MWQFLLYRGIYRWLFCGLIGVAIVSFLFYFNHLRKDNIQMKQKIFYLEKQLQACQKANAELTEYMKVQQKRYEKKISELLKKANQPPKIIEIPKIIEKPVYVPAEDCQKMAIMIDEFIKIRKERKK